MRGHLRMTGGQAVLDSIVPLAPDPVFFELLRVDVDT